LSVGVYGDIVGLAIGEFVNELDVKVETISFGALVHPILNDGIKIRIKYFRNAILLSCTCDTYGSFSNFYYSTRFHFLSKFPTLKSIEVNFLLSMGKT
jgi:hypothetical protein